MKTDPLEIAERLFGAIEAGDAGAVRALYTDATTVWHNHDGVSQTKEENLRLLGWMVANVKNIRYADVRRHRLPRGFVQQHVLRASLPGGAELEVPACMVVTVDDEGHITRIEEYFDSAQIAPLFASARTSQAL